MKETQLRKMGAWETIGHVTMILATGGLWWPAYRRRVKKIERGQVFV